MDHAPDDRRDDDHGGRRGHYGRHGWGRCGFPIWGLFMVVLGVGWLGGEVGWWKFNWSFVGPLAIIFVGVGMMLAWAMRRSR